MLVFGSNACYEQWRRSKRFNWFRPKCAVVNKVSCCLRDVSLCLWRKLGQRQLWNTQKNFSFLTRSSYSDSRLYLLRLWITSVGFLLVHCKIIVTSTFFQSFTSASVKKKKGDAWEEADKGRQRGRREGQNLIKFNKAERIAQAERSDWAFLSFTTSAYLNTFTPRPFICVRFHGEQRSWTQRETLIPLLFECWPRMATICANCLTLRLSRPTSHKYQRPASLSTMLHDNLHVSADSFRLTQTKVPDHF